MTNQDKPFRHPSGAALERLANDAKNARSHAIARILHRLIPRPGALRSLRARMRSVFAPRALAMLLGLAGLPAAAITPVRAQRIEPPAQQLWMESVLAGSVAGMLSLPAVARDRPVPVVLILHDTNGPGIRSETYAMQIEGAGIATFNLLVEQVDAASVRHALAALAADPRIDHRRMGALAFGAGGLGAIRAAAVEDGNPLAARALLYPGCAAVHASLAATPQAERPTGPMLLLHGDADAANTPAECGALQTALMTGAPTERVQYRGASYAWDRPQIGQEGSHLVPSPDGRGRIRSEAWPGLATVSAARVASFFAGALNTGAEAMSVQARAR